MSTNRVEQIERQENKEQLISTNRVEQDHEGAGDVPSPIERIGQVRVNTKPNYVDGLEQKNEDGSHELSSSSAFEPNFSYTSYQYNLRIKIPNRLRRSRVRRAKSSRVMTQIEWSRSN